MLDAGYLIKKNDYLFYPASLRGVGSTLSPSCRLYEPEARAGLT
jgi:hypothetical protein